MGIRNCIGRNLAYAEMRLIVAKLLWHFDIALDTEKMGKQEGKNTWTNQKMYVVWERRPLWVKVSPVLR